MESERSSLKKRKRMGNEVGWNVQLRIGNNGPDGKGPGPLRNIRVPSVVRACAATGKDKTL